MTEPAITPADDALVEAMEEAHQARYTAACWCGHAWPCPTAKGRDD